MRFRKDIFEREHGRQFVYPKCNYKTASKLSNMTKSFLLLNFPFFFFSSSFFFLQNCSYSSSLHTFRFSNRIETAFESKCEFERDERQLVRLEYDTQFDDEHHHLENEHNALTNFPVTAA